MDDTKRDEMLIEMHTDIKWIKDWIAGQNKYKFAVYMALITALISLLK